MFDKALYYATTFLEAGLSVFGIRALYEQPAYQVLATLRPDLEIRSYPALTAVQTEVTGADPDKARGEAFTLLFSYISGGNRSDSTVPMTVPVESTVRQRIAMTTPVETKGTGNTVTMRFFLPRVMAADPPQPTDRRVQLARVPARTVAALRFSGVLTGSLRAAKQAELLESLQRSSWRQDGAPYVLSYDPPFAIPALRRNEVVLPVVAQPN